MRRLCLVCIGLTAPLLAGCSLLLPPRPEPIRAMLSEVPNDVAHKPMHAVSLLVLPPETSPAYDTTRMAYTARPYQLAYFRDHEWAETPGQMIQPLLVHTLQQTGFFRAILMPPESGPTNYAFRTEILELVQDYAVSPPVLRLALRLQLFGASGQTVASRDLAVQETMREATPYAGVVAANDALARALRQAAQFVLDSAR